MALNIDGLTNIPEIQTVYPVDELTLRKIDLAKHVNTGDFKQKLVSILEAIIEYNKQWTTKKDRAYRIFYALRISTTVISPSYERLTPDKTALIISEDGEELKRGTLCEMIKIDEITGIMSDLFYYEDFDLDIDYTTKIKDLIETNVNEITEYRKKWISQSSNETTDLKYVQSFCEFYTEINKLNSYNSVKFFNQKRLFLDTFIDFLDGRIKQESYRDGTLKYEDYVSLKQHFSYEGKFKTIERERNF